MSENDKFTKWMNEDIVLAGIALGCLQRYARIAVDNIEQDPDDPESLRCAVPEGGPEFVAWAAETHDTLAEHIKHRKSGHPPTIDADKRGPAGMQALCMMFVYGFCARFMDKNAVAFAAEQALDLGKPNMDALVRELQQAIDKKGTGLHVMAAEMNENGDIVPIEKEKCPFEDVPELPAGDRGLRLVPRNDG